MGYTSDDATRDAADEERADKALAEARTVADTIAEAFTHDWRGSDLHPIVSAAVDVGGEDQPVFVFSLLLELDDDLDADEYPWGEVEQLQNDLRNRLIGTPVDEWDWIVTTGTKAGAARR